MNINIICTSSIATIQKALLVNFKLYKDEKDDILKLQEWAEKESKQ